MRVLAVRALVGLVIGAEPGSRETDAVDRHLREARAASALNHPNIHCALEEFYETFPQAREALLIGPIEFEAGALAELAPAL